MQLHIFVFFFCLFFFVVIFKGYIYCMCISGQAAVYMVRNLQFGAVTICWLGRLAAKPPACTFEASMYTYFKSSSSDKFSRCDIKYAVESSIRIIELYGVMPDLLSFLHETVCNINFKFCAMSCCANLYKKA